MPGGNIGIGNYVDVSATNIIIKLIMFMRPSANQLFVDSHGCIFEPFLGGGAMFFHLVSDRNMRFAACLLDTNRELITAYQIVTDLLHLTRHATMDFIG